MMEAWQDTVFKNSCYLILGSLFAAGILLFPFRKKNSNTLSSWASLKSWLFAAPVLVLLLSLGSNWPLAGFTLLAVWCAKDFFQLAGMFHRSDFVWYTYIAIILLAVSTHNHWFVIYNLMPMILFGAIALIPLMQNNAKNMTQYLGLSLICFLLIGWAFMHLAMITQWAYGPRYLIYIIILTEVCDNIALAASRMFGKKKIVDKITHRRTLEGAIISILCTLILAWAIRDILPNPTEIYWISSGLIAAMVGSLGDLILSVIRRDIGVKDVGIFIIGRGRVLDRMDRLIFVAPIYYYVLQYLNQTVS